MAVRFREGGGGTQHHVIFVIEKHAHAAAVLGRHHDLSAAAAAAACRLFTQPLTWRHNEAAWRLQQLVQHCTVGLAHSALVHVQNVTKIHRGTSVDARVLPDDLEQFTGGAVGGGLQQTGAFKRDGAPRGNVRHTKV